MAAQATVIRIALISPGDVPEERKIVGQVIDRLRPRAQRLNVALALHQWEDVKPDFTPNGVQERIFQELKLEECDIVLAVFWTRWGKVDNPPYSRTATEVRRVMDFRCRTTSETPELGVYFSERPIAPAEADPEFKSVQEFKKEIQQENLLLYGEYKTLPDFEHSIEGRISRYLDRLLLRWRTNSLTYWVEKEPSLLRAEGFAEAVGDINIYISGKHPSGKCDVTLAIRLEASTNITSSLREDGTSEVFVATASQLAIPLAYATHEPLPGYSHLTHVLLFSPVTIKSSPDGFDDVLVVQNLRVNVPQVAPWHRQSFLPTFVTVRQDSHEGVIEFHRRIWLGSPVKGVHFHAEPVSNLAGTGATSGITWIKLSFQCTVAVPGTVLLADLCSLPPGSEVFMTLFDLTFGQRENNGSPKQGFAVAVGTDRRGQMIQTDFGPTVILWDGRVPMVRFDPASHAAWRTNGHAGSFEFGLAVRRSATHAQIPAPEVMLTGGFGPYIQASDDPAVWGKARPRRSTVESTGLPVPRFRSTSEPHTITLA